MPDLSRPEREARRRPASARPEVWRPWRRRGMTDVAKLVEEGLFKRQYRDHRLEWMIKVGGLDVVAKGLERDNIRFGPDLS